MMKKISHTNNGNCQKCEEILNSFGGTYPYLKQWFIEKQKERNLNKFFSYVFFL